MTPECKTLLATAEGQKREFLRRIEGMSEDARQQAKPGAWSPQQAIAHLIRFEELLVLWADDLPPGARPGVKGRLYTSLVSGLMRAAIPTPTLPDFEVGVSTPDPLPVLKTRWDVVRQQLTDRLAQSSDAPNAAFLLDPWGGPLTARQALTLLETHGTYHLRRPPLRREG